MLRRNFLGMLSGLPIFVNYIKFPDFQFGLEHKLNIIKVDKDFIGVSIESYDYKFDNKINSIYYLTAQCNNLNDLSKLIRDVDEYLKNDTDYQRKREISVFIHKKNDFSFTYSIVKASEIKKYVIRYTNV